MPKQKTKKAAMKRFKTSSRGKVQHLPVGQAHFNARDNGKATRKKHSDRSVDSTNKTHIKELLPYA